MFGDLLKAIDSLIAKSENELEETLEIAGFVEPAQTVKDISEFEESLARAYKRQTAYILDELDEYETLWDFYADWENIKEVDMLGVELETVIHSELSMKVPALVGLYIAVVDPELPAGELSKPTSNWITDWSKEAAGHLKESSHSEVDKIVEDCLQKGMSIPEFTQALLDSGVRDEYYKAHRVAVTETLREHSYACNEAMLQNPAVTGKEWVHTGAENPRENHVALSGTVVALDEPFELTGRDGIIYYPAFPKDTILPASESVNCYCMCRQVVDQSVLGLPLEERIRLRDEALAELE